MVSLIKLERIKLGLSQIDLWTQTGIPQWRISLIERGLPPQPNEAAKIASALGVKPEQIFPNKKFGVPASASFAENSGDTEPPESVEL
jgi:transcriptional regulator with XRE-family HTH domain